jgi:acetylornithine deacetylase
MAAAPGALREAAAAVAPGAGGIGGATFWAEMSFLTALGIPCVYWAPGDIGHCHTAEEHVRIDELVGAVKALCLFLAGHCGAGLTDGGDAR